MKQKIKLSCSIIAYNEPIFSDEQQNSREEITDGGKSNKNLDSSMEQKPDLDNNMNPESSDIEADRVERPETLDVNGSPKGSPESSLKLGRRRGVVKRNKKQLSTESDDVDFLTPDMVQYSGK